MTTWREKQQNCKHCHGLGYHRSEARNNQGRPAWTSRCEHCQPHTFQEIEQAAAEEEAAGRAKEGLTP